MESRRWNFSSLMSLLLLAAGLAACGALPPDPTRLAPSPTPPLTAPAQLQSLPSQRPDTLRFEHFFVEDGLSQSMVRCILQDGQGYLWIGTEDGLNRYDGYTFKVYKNDPVDLESLSQNIINALIEDRTGNLWVGTANGGLHRYNRLTGKFSRFQNDPDDPKSLSSNQVNVIFEDSGGRLWVGTSRGGLNSFDVGSDVFHRYQNNPNNPNTLSSNTVYAIQEDQAGDLWIGTSAGLDRFSSTSNTFTHFASEPGNPTSLSGSVIRALFINSYGDLWVGTEEGGLYRLERAQQRFTRYQNEPANATSLSGDHVRTILQDRSGELWVGTSDGGLNLYDRPHDHFVRYRSNALERSSLSDDRILSMHADRAGILWVGTYNGLNRLDPPYKHFEHYTSNPQDVNSLGARPVFALQEDAFGGLWIGTGGGGVDRFDRQTGRFSHFRNNPAFTASLSSNTVRAMLLDSTQALWVGTANGLNRMDTASGLVTRYQSAPNTPGSLSYHSIAALAEDAQGDIWVATEGGGLNRLDRATGQFQAYQHKSNDPNTLSDNVLSTLYIDRDGMLWVGTLFSGLNRLDPRTAEVTRYYHNPTDANSLSDNYILSIYEDSAGILWVGTTGGLNRFDRAAGSFTRFREKDGLPNDYIYAILEDQSGYLWLSTNKGIARLDPAALTIKNFDYRDGLQSNEFNIGAALRTRGGELIFGGVNGITAFFPAQIMDNPLAPPVVLTALTRRGQPITGDIPEAVTEVKLAWPDNLFDFEFAALNLLRPEKNQYAYKLEGFDQDWNLIGNRRNGSYTNLPGNTYTLRLKASNNDGVWNEEGLSLRVIVEPPFWETWVFRILAGLGLALVILGGYQYRLRSIRLRNRALESQVSERTRVIEQRNQEIEALYRADERMHRYLALDQVLQALVDVAVELIKADKCAVFTWDENERFLAARVSQGFAPNRLAGLRVRRGEGLIGLVAAQGEPMFIEDTLTDLGWRQELPSFVEAVEQEGIRSCLYLAIRVGEKVFAVFCVFFTCPQAFDGAARRLYTTLAQRAALSIENARLFEQTKELVAIEERTRLARDLHDSAKQKAFAALAQLGASNSMLESKPSAARGHLTEAENLVHDVIQELTFVIQEMYPLELKEQGLAVALRGYVFEWENQNDIAVELKINGLAQLDLATEQVLYRVVQESLANVARHSRARQVDVEVSYLPESVDIVICDDGIGFTPGQRTTGIGLRSMQERVQKICGQLTIDSCPGKGTRVTVCAPLKNCGARE